MIYQYDLVQDKERKPHLKQVKRYNLSSSQKYNNEDVLRILNERIHLREFDSEHAYVVAFDDAYHILGIYNVSIGDFKSCDMHNRNVGIFLMLVGAKAFTIYHNHPNGELVASNEDRAKVVAIQTLGQILGVEFKGSFIVTDEGWVEMDKGIHFYNY